jgi:hypothetical protein
MKMSGIDTGRSKSVSSIILDERKPLQPNLVVISIDRIRPYRRIFTIYKKVKANRQKGRLAFCYFYSFSLHNISLLNVARSCSFKGTSGSLNGPTSSPFICKAVFTGAGLGAANNPSIIGRSS